jgi:hypothetical protein
MKAYLVRPRIKPDESLYGHLLRCAKANFLSPERMAHKIGLIHHYQLKPVHHTTISVPEFTQLYSARFRIDAAVIQQKVISINNGNAHSLIEWHGLRLHHDNILRTPRSCPICIADDPNLIREQWYLEQYHICHRHQCYMTTSQIDAAQSLLPFQSDCLIELSSSLDQFFCNLECNPDLVTRTQSLLTQLSTQRKIEVSNESFRINISKSHKQLNLFSNKHQQSYFSYQKSH